MKTYIASKFVVFPLDLLHSPAVLLVSDGARRGARPHTVHFKTRISQKIESLRNDACVKYQ